MTPLCRFRRRLAALCVALGRLGDAWAERCYRLSDWFRGYGRP